MKQIANILFTLSALFCLDVFAAHGQILLVVADDMNRSDARLQRFERQGDRWRTIGKPVAVNIGRNGLGWGIGAVALPRSAGDPVKHEGDGRAPAGVFTLGPVFGYAASERTAMPYLQATGDLICIDDSRADAYNRIVPVTSRQIIRSFEWMRRSDGLYRIGIVVNHNEAAQKGMGSCIFIHIRRAPGSGTAGCTSMAEKELDAIIRWLDPAKRPVLVQIPKKSLPYIREKFRLP